MGAAGDLQGDFLVSPCFRPLFSDCSDFAEEDIYPIPPEEFEETYIRVPDPVMEGLHRDAEEDREAEPPVVAKSQLGRERFSVKVSRLTKTTATVFLSVLASAAVF